MTAHTSHTATEAGSPPEAEDKHPFLVALGERIRALRSRRGITRKALSISAGVSERHLANLEYGEGNASIMVLLQIAEALQTNLTELVGDFTTDSPECLMIRALLENQSEETLREIRVKITELLGETSNANILSPRIALIGLRGAGKSTLGRMLAEDLGFPFVELSREIEKFAGCSIAEIQALYGMNAYRRYERRAIEEAIQLYPEAVICTPGGLVSDPVTFNELLAHCTTVWLQATPEDHMQRVMAQGDFRPMSGGSKEAMDDLKHILDARSTFYSKAQFKLDTSAQSEAESFHKLRDMMRDALQMPQ